MRSPSKLLSLTAGLALALSLAPFDVPGVNAATVSADAKPRDPLNLWDGGRNPERETLNGLTQGMERRLQDMARVAYENQRSIGD